MKTKTIALHIQESSMPSLPIRLISALVLFFFTWTLGGVSGLAHAAQQVVKQEQAAAQHKRKAEGLEERLSRITEELTTALADPKTDLSGRKTKLKAYRTELNKLDPEIRKQFAETEQKLKDAGLPAEILGRHTRFVKQYDTRLAELKGNLDRVEAAKGEADSKAALEQTRKYLQQVKAPSRHQKLDPNNLPFCQPKVIKREPRMKKEQFEQDLKKDKQAWKSAKRIMVAGTGSLAGLLTPDELAETAEVQLTPEIKAKALELGNNPVRIYEWVRNNVDYQAYYGAFKSAQQTLSDGAGNDFDQASLLIALLRASNIAAKYVYGTVEIPIEKIMGWLGGVNEPKMAVTILATQGIPTRPVISGGNIKAVQIEHVWVSALIDYIPSRGAVHKQGDTWITLDSSFKQYTSYKGMDMYSLMGFNAKLFLQSHITDLREIMPYQDYGMRLVDYVDENLPDAANEDIFGSSSLSLSRQIINKEYLYLLGTLPYKIIAKAGQFSEIPPSKRYSVNIVIEDNTSEDASGLNYSGLLSELSAKRITVSYEPATTNDEALVAQYGGIILAVPAYLLNVKPVLKISGVVVASGSAIGLGKEQNIIISRAGPDGDTGRIQNIITAGDYSAIILQAQRTQSATVAKNMALFMENNSRFNSPEITVDDLLGQMLYTIGVSYFYHLGYENDVYAKNLQLEIRHNPVEAMITHSVDVKYFFGLPRQTSEGGIRIDVDRNVNSVFSPTQDSERIKSFMLLSGLSSSAWESKILEIFFDIPSVSTVKLLKLASKQGIPIYTIDSVNQGDILPLLVVGSDVKSDIENAIALGKKVIVPQNILIYGKWRGAGYIVLNPDTGAAGYMISGGLAGGGTSSPPSSSVRYPLPQRPQPLVEPTMFLRKAVLDFARAYIGTPYVWGGKTESPGFDCSGFVHAVYAEATSPLIGKKLNTNAAGQYNSCATNKWQTPLEDRLPGDIIWRSNLKHVGIEAGVNNVEWPQNSSNIVGGETVVHASGRPCYQSSEDAPKGTPPGCIRSDCILINPSNPRQGGNPSCGSFNAVIESPVKYFATSIAENVCRPH